MNPPPHFPPFYPARPPPLPYQSFPPPPPNQSAPSFIYPFNLHPRPNNEAPTSSSSSTTATGAAATSSASDLPTALSALTSLLHLTRTTLNSISHLLPTPANSSTSLVACPFNRNHLVPASSLFSHYLSCPSSAPPLSADDLLQSLQYPYTLHSSATVPLSQPLENPNTSELCFSLENFLNFTSNFFYADCPGPVIFNSCGNDASNSPRMLTLPKVLYAECANSTCTSGYTDLYGLSLESIRLLPSEIWAVGEEMNSWGDFPASYSHRVLRAILKSSKNSLLCLSKWVIMNSPRYGVIIDLAMMDHIILLFKLCLKAVIREATKFASSLLTGGSGEETQLGGDKRKFHCPVLTNVMRWLGFQLSVLYSETNGKSFTINMLKQCVLDLALNSSVFPLVEKPMETTELKGVDTKLEGSSGKIEGDERKTVENGVGVHNSTISVCEVAAAVAALYERSWLERKIKAIWDSPPLTPYQRMVEHEAISRGANDERQKRSNYRPVIEHDGLLRRQTQNLESNRVKTREELLAEERDYKRRRMSYRGKKVKRSTTEVMRDIIDEYMEEIKQAGNIAKGAEEVESRSSVRDRAVGMKNQLIFAASRVDSSGHENHLHSHDGRSMVSKDKYLGESGQQRHNSRQYQGLLDNDRSIKRSRHDRRDYSRSPDKQLCGRERSIKRARDDRKEYSRSPDQRRSDSYSQRHRASRGNREDSEVTKEIFPRRSDRSRSMSYGQKSHHREVDEHISERGDKHTRSKHRDSRIGSSHVEFEDRYNPSEPHDTYENDA